MNSCLCLLAFIDDVGGPELLMILFVALLLFGGKKLPELAKSVGKSVREFKKAVSGVETEIKRAIDEATAEEPSPPPPKPIAAPAANTPQPPAPPSPPSGGPDRG